MRADVRWWEAAAAVALGRAPGCGAGRGPWVGSAGGMGESAGPRGPSARSGERLLGPERGTYDGRAPRRHGIGQRDPDRAAFGASHPCAETRARDAHLPHLQRERPACVSRPRLGILPGSLRRGRHEPVRRHLDPHRPGVVRHVVGRRTHRRVGQVCAAFADELLDDAWADLRVRGVLPPVAVAGFPDGATPGRHASSTRSRARPRVEPSPPRYVRHPSGTPVPRGR